MKKFILSLSLLISSAAFAEAPNAHQVFASVLKDSGFEASNIALKPNNAIEGDPRAAKYSLQFNSGGMAYLCRAATVMSREIDPGRYMVRAIISNCFDAHINQVKLRNDYTNEYGKTDFIRVFHDNNSRFDIPKKEEMHKWKMILIDETAEHIKKIDQDVEQVSEKLDHVRDDLDHFDRVSRGEEF